MKRMRFVILAAVAALVLALPFTAMAEHLQGSDKWSVTFTKDAKMSENFDEESWADDIGRLEPGDDITFMVNLKHEHPTTCDWYMSNEVIKSLEEGVAEGSAYSYKLTYTDPGGESKTLYDSDKVGGDNTEGLVDATNALDEFFFLDSLKQDDAASVQLKVGLDGETEGNAYFDTLAQLKMKFAVELNNTPTTSSSSNPPTSSSSQPRTPVQTGDDTNLFPFFVAMAVSGALLMALAIYSIRQRKRDKDEEVSQ